MQFVLVVDDKEENRYYLQALLTGYGYQVAVARHGAEALTLARQTLPDMVVSDLLMPVMDGYTLLRHWKADPQLQHVPFIVYTATYTQAEDEELALKLGADAFILKPAEPEDFVASIREVADRVRPRQPGPLEGGTVEDGSDEELLKHYSETLIRKLEEKSMQLEDVNATLAASEERFRLLAQATNDAVWDWDVTQDRRWWGAGFSNLFGYREGTVATSRSSWAELIHPDDRVEVLAKFRQTLASEDDWYAEYRFRRADGSWAHVEDRGHLVRNQHGTPVRMVGGISDVSSRKLLEERLHNAQRMEAVGQLTGGIAHDFNNLLTVVLGNAECLVEMLEDQPDAQSFAQMITDAAERGADLTRRLLTFARKQSLTPAPTDINRLINGLQPMLQRVLNRHIRFEYIPQPGLPPTMIDVAQMENALLNLCVNARDAMPDGGVLKIETSSRHLDKAENLGDVSLAAGDYLLVSVSDTGAGIAAEYRDKVFEPFFTTKPEGKGSGLGLAMVYGFVRQSGGYIAVESSPGEGARFDLYLPVVEAADHSSESPRADQGIALGSERVLLVEDEPQVRELARVSLESLGYQVTVAESGEQALARLDAAQDGDARIDLLFTDVQMSGMNGPELAARALVRQPGLPVLYTSGFTGSGERGPLPHTDFPVLGKPYRRAELAEAVAQVFGRSAQ
ncbi:response regulator [Pseudohongiella sp. SYSU M77423]|uniref:response regulator n=1 Tax=Pseudohongiella sp. SYSU M77423 TaxID=3042312 RepID=UPI00247FF900|nr:response regulator [Pseudohongiella sp. SYSU M77423]MDH7942570.1 response regulator [Pseudohongiella sp. SYSU M77423]